MFVINDLFSLHLELNETTPSKKISAILFLQALQEEILCVPGLYSRAYIYDVYLWLPRLYDYIQVVGIFCTEFQGST